jgi:tRNA G46 methylase TrmB
MENLRGVRQCLEAADEHVDILCKALEMKNEGIKYLHAKLKQEMRSNKALRKALALEKMQHAKTREELCKVSLNIKENYCLFACSTT